MCLSLMLLLLLVKVSLIHATSDHKGICICRGDPIPGNLIEKVVEYLPDDMTKLLSVFKVQFNPSVGSEFEK